MAQHQLRLSREDADQSSLFFIFHDLCGFVATSAPPGSPEEDVRPQIIRRKPSSEIDRKLIWPHFALFNPVISFSAFDRRNKQVENKSGVCVCVWGGRHVHECVISSAKASYSAAGFLSCQVIWGFLFVLRWGFFVVFFKCPPQDRKLRQVLSCVPRRASRTALPRHRFIRTQSGSAGASSQVRVYECVFPCLFRSVGSP